MKLPCDPVVKLEIGISRTVKIWNRCNEIKCRDRFDVGPRKVKLGCWFINVGFVDANKSICPGVIVPHDRLYNARRGLSRYVYSLINY